MAKKKHIGIFSAVIITIMAACGFSYANSFRYPDRYEHVQWSKTRADWQQYYNLRFNFTMCYPSEMFRPLGESSNGDGQRFEARDGAVILAFGSNNALGNSIIEEEKFIEDTLAGTVVDKEIDASGFLLTSRTSGRIVRIKAIYYKNIFSSIRLEYDVEKDDVYGPIFLSMIECFDADQNMR